MQCHQKQKPNKILGQLKNLAPEVLLKAQKNHILNTNQTPIRVYFYFMSFLRFFYKQFFLKSPCAFLYDRIKKLDITSHLSKKNSNQKMSFAIKIVECALVNISFLANIQRQVQLNEMFMLAYTTQHFEFQFEHLK